MQVSRKYFPEIILDNEEVYFQHLVGIIDAIDELAIMEIKKLQNSYSFRIVSSVPKYNELLLEEILKFHNIYGIKLNLSKSIKSSCTIVFSIDI